MLGLDKEVQQAQTPLDDWRHFIYATKMLGGVELGRVDHFDITHDEGSKEYNKDVKLFKCFGLQKYTYIYIILNEFIDI